MFIEVRQEHNRKVMVFEINNDEIASGFTEMMNVIIKAYNLNITCTMADIKENIEQA